VVSAKSLRLFLYYFLTPGSNWFYRFGKELELFVFLLKNFAFDAKTLKSIAGSLGAKQKPEHYYVMLHKIASDFDHFAQVLKESKSWATGRSMLQSVEAINVALEGIAEKSSGRSGTRFGDLFLDTTKLRAPITPKDRIWANADPDLTHIEQMSEKLLVSLGE
jgi:hypothetical protein